MHGDWEPTARIDTLRLRSRLLERIRRFFVAREVMEVETPCLSRTTATDPHLRSLRTRFEGPGEEEGLELYLQTSPEYAMKRLLAAGSGPIFQIAKVFRNGEAGRRHNPEFTMLEWYRPGFDHHALMDEVDELLGEILGAPPAERLTYREAFELHAGVDPHRAPAEALRARAAELGWGDVPGLEPEDRDGWLDLLMSHAVEPRLGGERPAYVYDFPASQSALARVRDGDPPVAERFEVFFRRVELANGYHELTDPAEQRRRFEADRERRRMRGLENVPLDERLLAALAHGMSDCAGVALGVDRLVMLAAGAERLAEVIAFPLERA